MTRFEVVVAANESGTAVDIIAIGEVLALDPDASFEKQAGGRLKLRVRWRKNLSDKARFGWMDMTTMAWL